MTHEQFSFWLEGYLAAGGTDIAVIRAKLAEIRLPNPHMPHVGIRTPQKWPEKTPIFGPDNTMTRTLELRPSGFPTGPVVTSYLAGNDRVLLCDAVAKGAGADNAGTWVGGHIDDQREALHAARSRTAAQAYAEQEEIDTQNALHTLRRSSEAH